LGEPIEVVITDPVGDGSAGFSVTLKSLASAATATYTTGSGSVPSSLTFDVTGVTSGMTVFAFNDLIVDTTGALPVELSGFVLE
jgi:hypothetical protein